MSMIRRLGTLSLPFLAAAALHGQEPQSIRLNELSPSVLRSAGDSNHAVQVVGDTLQAIWVARDRFAFPFYAEVDLKEGEVTRRMKLTEKRGRGKGLRMNPAIGRHQATTWVAWVEEIRRQRRSNFMLNLLEIKPPAQAEPSEEDAEEEAAQASSQPDPRQIFDLGRYLAPVTFHETAHGYFALTHSQDDELRFKIRLFRLGPEGKWASVEAASQLEGMKPGLLEHDERLWLYYMHPQGGISRASSQDGSQWAEPERIAEDTATSVQTAVAKNGIAVAWSISSQEAVTVRLSLCDAEGCSQPTDLFQRSGRLGRIVLSSQPETSQLYMLCSYWDHERQSQVIEALAEAAGFEGRRLTPEDENVSATLVPLLYNGADSAFAAWDQTAGREASTRKGGMVAVAEYDYGESRWKPSVATYLAGKVNMFATAPLLAKHGGDLWITFVAYRGPEVKHGYRQMPVVASTGDLYLVRVEPDRWEARGAEQAGKNYEPARN